MRLSSQPQQAPQLMLNGRTQSLILPKLKDPQPAAQLKLKYIQELEQRNRRLKVEIAGIRDKLEEHNEKSKKEKRRLVTETPLAVLKKELANAYQQIRGYEKEVRGLEERQTTGFVVADKIVRLENQLREKDAYIVKLRSELAALGKESQDISKRLVGNQKQDMEEKLHRSQQQMVSLRAVVREAEQKEKRKQENAKKQYNYIKRLQKQLLENGYTVEEELQDLKKNNIYDIYAERGSQEVLNTKRNLLKEEPITIAKMEEIKKEIFVKRKLQFEYQKKIEKLTSQKEEQERRVLETRVQIIQKENDIDSLQMQIKYLKKNIDKANLKPNLLPIPQQQGRHFDRNRMLTVKAPSKQTMATHGHLKYDQKGVVTQKGVRFTDRTILGQNFNTKIVGVKVWSDKATFGLCGIQCYYKIGHSKKPGGQHVKKDKQAYTENIFEAGQDDYIKYISGALSVNNTLEYLILMTAKSKVARYGVVKQNQKQFNFDIESYQLPVCMYGSLVTRSNKSFNEDEPGQPKTSFLEFLGFEITLDNAEQQSRDLV